MQYIYNGEEVIPEQWQWDAEYADGSHLLQFDPQGVFHQIKEIDQRLLLAFHMVNKDTRQRVTVLFPKGASLVHFYRKSVFSAGTVDETRITTYIFGYTLPHYRQFYILLPDNNIIITDDDKNVQIT